MKRNTKQSKCVDLVAQADSFCEAGNYKEARDALLAARRQSSVVPSAYVAWRLSIAFHMLDDLPRALAEIGLALKLDPLNLVLLNSYNVIIGATRTAVAAAAPDNPELPRLYEFLSCAGLADASSHLAMAAAHIHAGRTAPALKLLTAVTVLEPLNRQAWSLVREAAAQSGDKALATEARHTLAALGPAGGDGHFEAPRASA